MSEVQRIGDRRRRREIAAEAVQKSIKIFIEVLQDIVGEAVTVELADLCCDSGGGAAAQM